MMYNVLHRGYKKASPFLLGNDGLMEVEKPTQKGTIIPFLCFASEWFSPSSISCFQFVKISNREVKNQSFTYCICLNPVVY